MNDQLNEALSMEELEGVTGGVTMKGRTMKHRSEAPNYMDIYCTCGTINKVDINKYTFVCSKCHRLQEISG